MKLNFKLIILLVAVCLTGLLFVINSRQPRVDRTENKNTLYLLGKDLNDQFSGRKVSDMICTDTLGASIKLSNLVAKKRTLVLYYSELHCRSCRDKGLKFIQSVFSKTKLPVVVLGSYSNYRSFKIFREWNPIRLPIYRVEHHVFDWSINDYGMPYFFVLNPNMTASYFCIPSESHLEIAQQYLERVKILLAND